MNFLTLPSVGAVSSILPRHVLTVLKVFPLTDVLVLCVCVCVRACVRACVGEWVGGGVRVYNVGVACLAFCYLNCLQLLL